MIVKLTSVTGSKMLLNPESFQSITPIHTHPILKSKITTNDSQYEVIETIDDVEQVISIARRNEKGMVINSTDLLEYAPIKNMLDHSVRENGLSHGLSYVGYDIRLDQRVSFFYNANNPYIIIDRFNSSGEFQFSETIQGRFCLASAMEEFDMPDCLEGTVHDKSTLARTGLQVFNTVIEPGWKGFLTLEFVFNANEDFVIERGSGIAQVIFRKLSMRVKYKGKYQNQGRFPTEAIFSGE